ncbi:MAG: putative glycosyltransferase [Glaciecola sp.]|jgi:predicted glycosyltransferase
MRKTVLFYCQHSIGIGHLVRSFALVNSLKKSFHVTLVSGGDFPKGMKVPEGINFVQLPAIGVDVNNNLMAIGTDESTYNVMKLRQKKILHVYDEIQPDIFISEYFPFGKVQFMGELLPLLKRSKSSDKPMHVVCSLRDILEPNSMAKKMQQDFSVKIINEYYDGILVHGDESLITLDKTCPQLDRLIVPIHYTGYVTDQQYSPKIARETFKEIVLSAGGGKIAPPFICKMVRSFKKFGFGEGATLKVIAGPIYPNDDWESLQELVKDEPNITLIRSVESLSELWKQARLSISPGGYNTLMELICSRIPALIIPHRNESNSEQEIRAIRLQEEGLAMTIEFNNSSEEELAVAVRKALDFVPADKELNLNGAENTRIIIEEKFREYSNDHS